MAARWRQRGFSLLETALVVVMVAALAALAAPRYASSLDYYHADMAARRVAADLAACRDRAFASGASGTITFNAAGDSYQVSNLRGLDRAAAAYVVSLTADPYHCDLAAGCPAQVTFNGYGIPDRGGQVVVRAGGIQRTVVLDAASGRATVQP